LQIPTGAKPLIDYWMRDTYVTPGPDGFYYLTGTTADLNRRFDEKGPHCWDWNDGIYLWRSRDLKDWEALGCVWSLNNDATWQKKFAKYKPARNQMGFMLDAKRRAVWAPEIHYIKSATNWFMVACMNDSAPQKGSFILRSASGRAEGPYENISGNASGPIFDDIDGSLFEDDDGTVWFVGHNHFYAKMKTDMSGFDGNLKMFSETKYSPEPYLEGAYVVKSNGKYHLLQAAWSFKLPDGTFTYDETASRHGGVRWSYDCIVADADRFEGSYGPRYTVGAGIGHNNFFQDGAGNWWATMFGNPRGTEEFKQSFLCRPTIVPLHYINGQFAISQKNVQPGLESRLEN
jgi:beta-xylosidase